MLSFSGEMAEEVVRIEGVWVRIGASVVLEDVNLSIKKGDFLGIIGPNGGGKTTLLRVILGLVRPERGKVRVFGMEPEEGRKFVGYVPQYTTFDLDFPIRVWDVVLMGRLEKRGLFRRYRPEDEERALRALEMVEMEEFKDREVKGLSGGQLQRVLIARALATEPKLLLMDEPTSSIDLPVQTEIFEILHRLRGDVTIVMVTHDIGALSVYVDKIACLNRRLFYHDSKEIRPEELEEVYQCPVALIAHGAPHRVLKEH